MRSYIGIKSFGWSNALAAVTLLLGVWLSLTPAAQAALPGMTLEQATSQVQPGDLVFIRIDVLPFRQVAEATGTWTNHVGIVLSNDGTNVTVAESTFPRSRTTTLAAFVKRSERRRLAVVRLRTPPDSAQMERIVAASRQRLGIHYDTGFDLYSRGQFCSRFVHEILQQAMGITVGEVTDFGTLLKQRPDTSQTFWKVWYLGSIPWQRRTVTPASELNSPLVAPVLDAEIRAS